MFTKILLSAFIMISAFSFSQEIKESENLYIFIGKKISVEEFNPNTKQEKRRTKEVDPETGDTLTVIHHSYVMDNAFHCKYSVMKNLINRLPKETVEFNAYDHYGRPGFEEYENVILYISKNKNGDFFHQKYIYDPVYKVNGKWLGIIKPSHDEKKFKTIDINKDDIIKIALGSCDKICQKMYYPSPYFKIKNGFAYPKKALDIDDIISYRKTVTFKINEKENQK
ncbi:hypothetical protein QWZ06_02920 [Chryseobacterium tructae]|uniref:GLPGLI family protein n=1 Tax=Chryseobacterium tructae TaxID=1037380 RepID=A0ABV7XSF5_9FLAO|nr:hypothetical protein [Chryseobacterium tructae]MDN3691283.1 hypothetical protein [Chryseobacterium tructae]